MTRDEVAKGLAHLSIDVLERVAFRERLYPSPRFR